MGTNNGAYGLLGRYGVAAVVEIYGESGTGKSTEQVKALAGRTLHLGPPGGTKPAVGFLNYPVADGFEVPIKGLSDGIAAVRAEASKYGTKRVLAVSTDDLSVLANQEFVAIAKDYPPNKTFQKWDHVKGLLSEFCQEVRYCGYFMWAGAHLVPPSTDDKGVFHKGGPKMPAKSLTAEVPHIADLVMRTVRDDSVPGPWKIGYHCLNGSATWYEKDRHGILSGLVPQSLYEILRAASYNLPRPIGLEWMEPWVAQIADKCADPTVDLDHWLNVAKTKLLAQGRHPAHVLWCLQDAATRVAITRKTAWDKLLGFYDGKPSAGLG